MDLDDRLTIYVKYPGWFTLGSYYWRLCCSWVGDELASGEPRESKGLLQSSPSLIEISKESAELWLGKAHSEHIHVPLFSSCSCSTGHIFWQPTWYHCWQLEFSHLMPFCFYDTDLLQIPQGYFLCLVAWSFVSNSRTWKAIRDFFRGIPVAHHVKIRFGLFFIVRTIFIAKAANRIAENLYRFSIHLLSLNNVSERAKFVACQFPTRRSGRLVNKRNPPGYWLVKGSDLANLGQIISWVFPIMILFRLGLAFS